MIANWVQRFIKRGSFPQKVGSKPQRCERIYKRTAKAQRDFLRGGAVLLPGGERPAPTEPAGETRPYTEAAFCAEKCGEVQGLAATWEALIKRMP